MIDIVLAILAVGLALLWHTVWPIAIFAALYVWGCIVS